jgi:hypothetical protein
MNSDQVTAFVRGILTAAGPTALALGVPANAWTVVGTIITTLAPVLYSIFFVHTDAAKVTAASTVPGVAPIQVLPSAAPAVQAVAADSSVPKVVPARAL